MRRIVSGTARKIGFWLGALALGFPWWFGQSLGQWAPPDQALQYAASSPKTILELQQFRRTTSRAMVDPGGQRGTATLIELNPDINAWYLLQLLWDDPAGIQTYHLENPDPQHVHVTLAPSGQGLLIVSDDRETPCTLWPDHTNAPLEEARRSGLPYAPLCDSRLYLRNAVRGTYTRLEEMTNFLRDHVWGGDRIVNFVKEEFFRDHFAENAPRVPGAPAGGMNDTSASEPLRAQLDIESAGTAVVPEHLGLDVVGAEQVLTLGSWLKVNQSNGVYVSAIRPESVADPILNSFRARVANLDGIESNAVDYLVAFDLEQFDLGFALGTDHPRIDWSGRELPEVHDEHLAGPDGVGTSAPLVRNGMVNPALIARTVATFAGGFKREHGAFRYGDLARQNQGSHYGFIEQGAVFSKLQPGLATVYVLEDGTVGMKTWTRQDDAMLSRIKHARQNGVPLIEGSGDPGVGIPGPLVAQWGAGNWSGSANERLRTLRAGLCLQWNGSRRFLIYGYFSTATPSAMARVFQAYRCQYAMHLDMNALEHTYLALYTRQEGRLVVQHLIDGMSEVDRKGGSQVAPRFLGFPDDRDFFYLLRRPTTNDARGAIR